MMEFDGTGFDETRWRDFPSADDFSLQDAREVLNLLGAPSVPMRQLCAADAASREQAGHRVSLSRDSVLDRARSMISCAEIGERTRWSPRRIKAALKQHRGLQVTGGLKRAGIIGLALPQF